MKKLLVILSVATVFATGTAFTYSHFAPKAEKSATTGSYFDVRIENKCSHDVKLRTEADGSASETTVYKNSSESHSVRAGYKLYVDGTLFREMKEEDAGKTFVICE